MISKVIISHVEKKDKTEWVHSGCRRKKKKGDTSRRQEADAKWKTDYSFVDAQVLKTYLFKPLEAKRHMFKFDYSCFITLKLSLRRGQKIKAAVP